MTRNTHIFVCDRKLRRRTSSSFHRIKSTCSREYWTFVATLDPIALFACLAQDYKFAVTKFTYPRGKYEKKCKCTYIFISLFGLFDTGVFSPLKSSFLLIDVGVDGLSLLD